MVDVDKSSRRQPFSVLAFGVKLAGDKYAIVSTLNPEETEERRTAVAQAVADKTYFIAQPFHCAIGSKPEIAR